MENNKNKKSVKFQGDMLNFCDFIQVFVFTRNHHLNMQKFSKGQYSPKIWNSLKSYPFHRLSWLSFKSLALYIRFEIFCKFKNIKILNGHYSEEKVKFNQ